MKKKNKPKEMTVDQLAVITLKSFSHLEKKVDILNDEIKGVKDRLDKVEDSLGTVENKISAIEDTLNKVEKNTNGHEHRISHLEDDARVIKTKLDI
jgi:predicted  nucleic acid-binding Zn-ribbon protein